MLPILAIIWLHFIGDFILQSNKMAINKSKSVAWLSVHIAIYSLALLPFGINYAMLNALLHWCVDFITSRATTWAWKKEKRHLFFTIIGFDQAIHLTCLFATGNYLCLL